MIFGQGDYTYTLQENWWTLPEGWSFGWIPAVAVDSHDRVYVYSRSEHPMVVFDREVRFCFFCIIIFFGLELTKKIQK